MDFTQASIYTTTAGVDPVIGVLTDVGIEGWVLEDAQDFEDFLQDTEIYWDYVDDGLVRERRAAETRIQVYLTMDADGEAQLAGLRERLAALRAGDADGRLGRLAVETETVRQQDWEWGWKQYFKPFPVGERFAVKPSWETYSGTDGRMVLEIDPASSFGTGSHETTQLCITALEQTVRGGERVLDMGTGSGILAIAAAMLGAKVGAVVDIDENCLKTAQENAEKNGVSIGQSYCGDVLHEETLSRAISGPYEIITANIVADVIIGMCPWFAARLTAGGTLICSGVLEERADEVETALSAGGFTVGNRAAQGGWVRFTAVLSQKAAN